MCTELLKVQRNIKASISLCKMLIITQPKNYKYNTLDMAIYYKNITIWKVITIYDILFYFTASTSQAKTIAHHYKSHNVNVTVF